MLGLIWTGLHALVLLLCAGCNVSHAFLLPTSTTSTVAPYSSSNRACGSVCNHVSESWRSADRRRCSEGASSALASSSSGTVGATVGKGGLEDYNGDNYKAYISRGMMRFRDCRIEASLRDFDKVVEIQPSLAPYMWQRGLSLYYDDRFAEGAEQFRKDVSVNPNDTEEAIWALLCEARQPSIGFDKAQKSMIPLGKEPRPVMKVAYNLFAGKATPEDLAKFTTVTSDNRGDFYSKLYLGLYHEAKGHDKLAQMYITMAVNSPYGSSGDYMYSLAAVHQHKRGW